MSRRASTVLDETQRSTQLLERLDARRAARSRRDAGQRARPRAGHAIVGRRRQTFQRRGRARRSRERDAIDAPGSTRAGGVDAGDRRSFRSALGIEPDDTIAAIEAEIFDGSLIADVGMGRASPRPGAEARRHDQEQARAVRRAAHARPARERIEAYLDDFLHRPKASRARPVVTKAIAEDHPDLCRAAASTSRSASARCSSASAPSRRATAARRCSPSPHEVIARYRAEKDRRGLLDYDDLIDKTLALLEQRRRRLGALQARPRHRPRADRRGAGHQPEAVGDHQAPRRRVLRRRRRARPSRARSSRSATRSSRSSRSRARRRTSSPRCASYFEPAHADAGLDVRAVEFEHSFRSAPIVLTRSTRCSTQPAPIAGLTADADGDRARSAAATRRRAWSRSGRWSKPDERTDDRGLGCAVRHEIARQPARSSSRGEIAAQCRARSRDRRRRQRHALRAGDVLVLVRQRGAAVRGGHPRAEERGHRRSPAPTGWC